MKLELALDQIEDRAVREALSRIQEQFKVNPLLGADWKLFDVSFSAAGTNVLIKHNLPFTPSDVLLLYIEGNRSFLFNHSKFDRTNISVDVGGACRVRFIAGRVGR